MKWLLIILVFILWYVGIGVHHVLAVRKIRRASATRRARLVARTCERLYQFTGDPLWLNCRYEEADAP